MSAKKVYKIRQPYAINNTTIWEFDNVILELYNDLGKNLYSKVNHALEYIPSCGYLRILPKERRFSDIISFSKNEVALSKRTISNNMEFKNDNILLYCNNVVFKIKYDLCESENFYSINIKYIRNSAKDIYRISLPIYYNGYLQGMTNMYIAPEETIIYFDDLGQLLQYHISKDQDFIDCYNELVLGKI